MSQYQEEAKQRWGQSKAYRQSKRRTDQYSAEDWSNIHREATAIYARFYQLRDSDLNSQEAREVVEMWKAHVSRYYYDCTDQILAGLGEMYIADSRFQENIDQHGVGTAATMSEAIRCYCSHQ